MIILSKVLNVASILLFIIAIFGMVFGISYLLLDPMQGKVLEVTESEVRAFNSDFMDVFVLIHRSEGLYMLCLSLFLCFVSLMPFRKGEKWAWYLTFMVFGLAVVGQTIVTYIGSNVLASYYFPASVLLLVLWLLGLLLPIKEFFS